jgi:hypothetical protein
MSIATLCCYGTIFLLQSFRPLLWMRRSSSPLQIGRVATAVRSAFTSKFGRAVRRVVSFDDVVGSAASTCFSLSG